MRVWRIATAKWALDMSCAGTRSAGGRWNPVGVSALYAGTTIELCSLEKFVHLAGAPSPPLKLVAVDVPDLPDLHYRPAFSDLPGNWADMPVSSASQEFGKRWIESSSHLMMFVPSAVIPESLNVVINPLHPAFKSVALHTVRDFTFDARMFKPRGDSISERLAESVC